MKNKIIISILMTVGILILNLSIGYAIYNYRTIGNNQQLVLGEIYMNATSTTGEIEINDILPSSTYNPNNYYEFTVSGKNTYTKQDIYYEIILSHGEDSKIRTERIRDKFLKFRLVEVENGEEIELIDNRSYMGLENKRIYVDIINKNTMDEINKTYRLYVWISDEILIGNISEADYDIDTWNNQIYANLNVTVHGDLYEKYIPDSRLARVNTNAEQFWPSEIESIKTSINEINFINLTHEEIDDVINTNLYLENSILNNKVYDLEDTGTIGSVKGWLIPDTNDSSKYIMYIASEEDLLYLPNDSSYMFNGFTSVKSINYLNVKLDTSLTTSMRYMFGSCSSLVNIDVSNFDTSNVTNVSHMFHGCSRLTNLNITNFNTLKVTQMHNMFTNCSSLTSLDVSNFITTNVTRMDGMFSDCSGLTSLNLNNFDTSKVMYMYNMFSGCSSLISLDLSNFDTSKVTNMGYMFFNCESLTSLDLSNFDTSKVTIMDGMFWNCSSLTSLDLSNFDTSKVTSMISMFSSCSNLKSLDLTSFDTSNVTAMNNMFNHCNKLTELNISNFDTSQVTRMEYMFNNCRSLLNLDLSNFDTSKVTNMGYMFSNCESLTSLDLSNFDTSSVIYMNHMFYYTTSLQQLNVGSFDTSEVTTMERMFDGLREIIELDLSSFDTSKVTNMDVMLGELLKIKTIYVSNKWTVASVTTSVEMFRNDYNLVGGNGTKYSSSYIDKTYARIDTAENPGYFTYKEYVPKS